MPEQPSPEAWRRRLRISVRGLMALVLIVGGGLGWVIHRAHVQRDAVAAIQSAERVWPRLSLVSKATNRSREPN